MQILSRDSNPSLGGGGGETLNLDYSEEIERLIAKDADIAQILTFVPPDSRFNWLQLLTSSFV